MATYKTKGIILRRTNVSEADRLVTVFTDTEGKIKIRAKGVRWLFSRNRGHLELFSYSDLVMAEGRETDVLVSAYTIEIFKSIRNDLKKTGAVYYLAEICDKMTVEKEKNERIFNLFLDTLRFLDILSPSLLSSVVPLLTSFFELNLLSALGFRPELSLCVHCRKKLQPIANFFSYKLGGVICPSCSLRYDPKSLKIDPSTLKALRVLLSYNLEIALKVKIDERHRQIVKKISEGYLRYIAEREFKSKKFILSVNKKQSSGN